MMRKELEIRVYVRVVAMACCLMALLAPGALALEAGAAKTELEPPLGAPLNGYLDRWGRGALDRRDPLYARALFLRDGDTALFLVSVDVCVINRELRERVLAMAPDVAPAENIILTATHTHNGPGGMVREVLWRAVSGPYRPDVLETTATRIAEAMRLAYAARQRAAIGFATRTQDDLSANRRFDEGPRDPQVGIIRVEDVQQQPIAVIGSLAAHPTTVPEEDAFTFSADFPGYFYEELERLTPPGCMAMFLAGALGDQSTASPGGSAGWARTEEIGRELAQRVHAAAVDLECSELPLHVVTETLDLPPTLAPALLPTETVVTSLELGGLALSFFPGEPCALLGTRLRDLVIARGYDAHMTVGLANDHVFYFAPADSYGRVAYESMLSFYGPRVEDLFYRRFTSQLRNGTPLPDRQTNEAESAPWAAERPLPEPEAFPGGAYVLLAGTPWQTGRQRGAALRGMVQQAYDTHVAGAVASGTLLPEDGPATMLPAFIDPAPVALPLLAARARGLLPAPDTPAFHELEGLAHGAGMPFDAAWLLQCVPAYRPRHDLSALYPALACTMAAVVGERAGADDVRVARNLDWPDPEPATVLEVHPDQGHRYFDVGFPWMVGVLSGMNDAGLVLCVERDETLGLPTLDGPPVEVVVRDVLQRSGSVAEAVERLAAAEHVRGYRVLVAGLTGDPEGTDETRFSRGADACVLAFGGEAPAMTRPDGGLLMGQPADAPIGQPASNAQQRYARMRDRLADERIVAAEELEAALLDHRPGAAGAPGVYNEDTRQSVVFEPALGRIRLSVRGDDGEPTAFHAFAFTPRVQPQTQPAREDME